MCLEIFIVQLNLRPWTAILLQDFVSPICCLALPFSPWICLHITDFLDLLIESKSLILCLSLFLLKGIVATGELIFQAVWCCLYFSYGIPWISRFMPFGSSFLSVIYLSCWGIALVISGVVFLKLANWGASPPKQKPTWVSSVVVWVPIRVFARCAVGVYAIYGFVHWSFAILQWNLQFDWDFCTATCLWVASHICIVFCGPTSYHIMEQRLESGSSSPNLIVGLFQRVLMAQSIEFV